MIRVLAVSVLAVQGLAWPAAAQDSANTRIARVLEPDAEPTPESGAADPLTPRQSDAPAPLAPGASPVSNAPAEPAEVDPVVALVRQNLAAAPPRRGPADREDVGAALAFYASRGEPVWTSREGLNARGRQALAEIGNADNWGLKASAFELPALSSQGDIAADVLADAELKLSLAVLKYARHARGGRIEPSSASRKFDQKPVIFEPKSVLLGIAAADAADAYLRGLHPKHPQFALLQQALASARSRAAEASAKSGPSIQQLVVNMERWRWMPPDLGDFYVWDSIPEQMTYVVDGGKITLSEKIVVGKLSSPTPIFSADMQFVIFHPSWGVPPGMKQYELLPQLRNTGDGGWFSSKPLASAVLKGHGLRVTRGGAPVNPDSINWNAVDIRSFEFEQPPGPTNVLGVVKFRFPNRHDVYMHDTPERHLFGGAVRAFSHGCMRVQNPIHLAEVLLAHDKGWPAEKVREQSRRGGEIKLSNPIPVHVSYFTVWADEGGGLSVRPDIYGLDGRVASSLEGREVQIATTAAAGKAEAKQRVVQVVQKRREPRKAEAQQSFNPFGGLFGN